MPNKILILHVSDIHIKEETDAILDRASSIASTTYRRLPEISAIVIVITGDIAFAGTANEYKYAEKFINQICAAIRLEKPDLSIEVFVCPGNHDCDFSLNDDTRDAVLSKIRGSDVPPTTSLIKTATSVQSDFFNFRDSVSSHEWSYDSKLSWQTNLKVGSYKIGIRSLNVAWMSEIREKQGALVFPNSEIIPFKMGESHLSITLLHHPYNWFSQASYRPLQQAVRRESQIVFTGHEHVQNVGEVSDLRNPSSVYVEGGVLFERNSPQDSSFNTILVELEKLEYLPELYVWDGARYQLSDDSEIWGSLRSLGVQNANNCLLEPEWVKTLKDPGANFTHSAKQNLELDDFYVWPEIQYLDDPATIKKNVLGSYFVDIQNLNAGIFIRGDEKVGKTALLYQYFNSYYDRGYLPVYFRGAWFSKAHMSNPLKALKFALEKQYERSCHSTFQQSAKSKRILLLDDIDSSTLTSENLSECLKLFFEYFENVIVTATDAAAAMDILSMDKVEALRHFSQYEIREFGHKKRLELVCKWAEVGGQSDVNSMKWMENIDKWERDLTTAVGTQLIPAVPIFLLTLLQSIEAGRAADLQQSAFGHYYQFLITSSLQNLDIDREQWAEVFNYCAQLAWFIFSSEVPHVPENQLRKFTSEYEREYTSVFFERRLNDLIKAGILTKYDGEVSFKYPYLYFYFIGQYIAERINDADMDSTLNRLCQNLHLRENANILLFSCHHTKSPIIYEKIASTLDNCFVNDAPFDFERDVTLLNSLVNTVPSLGFDDKSVKESRMQYREHQDNSENGGNFDFATEASTAILRLFRAMEILGQFLKNHYGTTRNPVKDVLLKKVIDGSLRGLHGITSALLVHTDELLSYAGHEADAKGQSREDRIAQTKRVIFDLMSAFTFAFVHKASSSIGSIHLKGNLQNLLENSPTLAYELVAMSYVMELPDDISLKTLKDLNSRLSKNVFTQALLRTLALKRLHLFKVPYQDKQKLCTELGIGLKKQMVLQHDRVTRS